MFDISGKTAFITGGTSGIGLAIARRFATAGVRVCIVGRRDGKALAEEIGGLAIQADVADESQLRGAIETAAKELGKLDIMINNAGIENSGPTIEEQDADEFQRAIDINLKAVYNGLHYGPRHMNDGGCIINMSSTASSLGVPGYGQYGATKAAVNQLTKNSALELVGRKIRVNAVAPGSVWSEMLPKGHPEVPLTETLAPMGRIGEPEEVAGLCHFLASPEAAYITGQIIYMDGGITVGLSVRMLESLLG